jgi:hypothetical protein
MKKLIMFFLIFSFCTFVNAADIGQWTTLKKDYLIATSKELQDQALQLLISKDEEALDKLILAGGVDFTKGGEQVYVVNIHPFSGLAEVRLRGETDTLWTAEEALN